MKNRIITLSAIFCSLFLAGNLLAQQQDKVVLRNGTVIEGSVMETSDEYVKIRIKRDDGDELIRTFSREELDRIEFRDGAVEKIGHELEVTPVLDISEMRHRGIKVNFFGPLNGHLDITYENQLNPGRAYEVTLGIIGLGKNPTIEPGLFSLLGDGSQRDAAGAFVSGGFKFQTKPTYRWKNLRYTHLMQGWFVKPTITAGAYAQNRRIDMFSNSSRVEMESLVFGALEIKGGRQWVFNNIFYMGADMGLGYVFDNSKKSSEGFEFSDLARNHYALAKLGSDQTNFAISFMFQVGILF